MDRRRGLCYDASHEFDHGIRYPGGERRHPGGGLAIRRRVAAEGQRRHRADEAGDRAGRHVGGLLPPPGPGGFPPARPRRRTAGLRHLAAPRPIEARDELGSLAADHRLGPRPRLPGHRLDGLRQRLRALEGPPQIREPRRAAHGAVARLCRASVAGPHPRPADPRGPHPRPARADGRIHPQPVRHLLQLRGVGGARRPVRRVPHRGGVRVPACDPAQRSRPIGRRGSSRSWTRSTKRSSNTSR